MKKTVIILFFFILLTVASRNLVYSDYRLPNAVRDLTGKAISPNEIKWIWTYDKKYESTIDGFLIYENKKLITQVGEIGKTQRSYILDGLSPSKEYILSVYAYKLVNGIAAKSKIASSKAKTQNLIIPDILSSTIKSEIKDKDIIWRWDMDYYNSILKKPEDYIIWFSSNNSFNKKVAIPLIQGSYIEKNALNQEGGRDYNITRYFMLVNKAYNTKGKYTSKTAYVQASALVRTPSVCIDEIGIGYARIRITDNSTNEAGFKLYYKTKDGDKHFIATISSTSGAGRGKEYFYTVNDFNIDDYYGFYASSVDRLGNESPESNLSKVESMADFSKENFLDDKKAYNIYEYTNDNLLFGIKEDGKWGYIKKISDDEYKIAIEPQFDESAQYFIGRYLPAKYITTKIEEVEVINDDGTFYVDEKKKKKTKTEKWGYYYYEPETGKINKTMDFIFDEAKDFVENYARVKIYNRWGFITNGTENDGKNFGEYIINPKFEDCRGFYGESLAPVKYNGKWGFISKNGNFYLNPKFEDASFFSEGLAPVKLNNKWGFINKNGKFVIDPIYDGACKFSEGLAAVKIDKKWGFINQNGDMNISPKYDNVDWKGFSEGLAPIKLWNNWGYIDKSGRIVIEPQFDYVSYFVEGWAAVGLKDTHEKSNEIKAPGYKESTTSSKNSKENMDSYFYGIINKDGKYIWTPTK